MLQPSLRKATDAAARLIVQLPLRPQRQLSWLERIGSGHRFVQQIDQVAYVPTESITHYCLFKHPKRRFVLEGDWDLSKKELFPGLLNHPHFSCVYELAEGRAYWETQHFAKMMKALQKNGRTERGIANEEGVHDYFRKLVQIFTDVQEHGYKSQRELGKSGSEIRVSVDRTGALLKYYEGHHRLAIAKVLGIKCIPVCVQFVHREWFDRCCERFRGNIVATLREGLLSLEPVQTAELMRRPSYLETAATA